MALYAIGDLHLCLGAPKPMDIFGGAWVGYMDKLRDGLSVIRPEDTTVLLGDLSWALDLSGAKADFAWINAIPGRKIILKGNHDYWWSTAAKFQKFCQENGFENLNLLNNNCYEYEGVAICGTRGWLFDVGEPHDEKVMNREIGRLKMSLDAAEPGLEKLVFLHYPPVYTGTSAPEIVATLKAYGITRCFYGHLHGGSHALAMEGLWDGVDFRLVAADYTGFRPYKVIP